MQNLDQNMSVQNTYQPMLKKIVKLPYSLIGIAPSRMSKSSEFNDG